MLRVCALANKIGGDNLDHLLALERSLTTRGVPFFFHYESGRWKWRRKIMWEQELVNAHPDDYFVFIDAFDYLFLGTLPELESIVTSAPLLFSCDCGDRPWPSPNLARFYNQRRERKTPWCWVNGSGPAGKGETIADAIQFGLDSEFNGEFVEQYTDQLFWTLVYLSGRGELDQECRLTQALWDGNSPTLVTPHLGHKDGRVTNLLTGTQPQFLHATGKSWAAIPEELWR